MISGYDKVVYQFVKTCKGGGVFLHSYGSFMLNMVHNELLKAVRIAIGDIGFFFSQLHNYCTSIPTKPLFKLRIIKLVTNNKRYLFAMTLAM
jgi:hypothetical protein